MVADKTDYAHLKEEELQSLLAQGREKLFQAKFQNATAPNKNPHEITKMKRDVARCLTFLRQLEKQKEAAPKGR